MECSYNDVISHFWNPENIFEFFLIIYKRHILSLEKDDFKRFVNILGGVLHLQVYVRQ